MSIVRTALRICARKAIDGRTMAEGRIRDSDITTLEDALSNAPAPIVLIYTDDADAEPTGRDLWSPGVIDLVFLVSVAGAFKVTLPEDENGPAEQVTEFRFATTDTSMELSIDVIERQIKIALSDPDNPWAVIFNRIVNDYVRWKSTRGSSGKQGAKFAARQIIARVNTINDPVPGVEAVGAWADFLAAIEADTTEQWGAVPKMLRAMIEGRPLAPGTRDAMHTAISHATLRKIGLQRTTFVKDGPGENVEDYYATGDLEDAGSWEPEE